MRLNPFETFIVNNPVRDRMLRGVMDFLHASAGAPAFEHALEIGCGRGAGIAEIVRRFRPRALDAFDLDEKQTALARKRLVTMDHHGTPVRLWTGSAEHIDAEDGRYDAVFELTILHHVTDWRKALAEIRRVLRPGGMFLFEELSSEFFEDLPVVSALLRRFTDHPWHTMFDFDTFRRGLDEAGLRPKVLRAHLVPGWHQGVAVRD